MTSSREQSIWLPVQRGVGKGAMVRVLSMQLEQMPQSPERHASQAPQRRRRGAKPPAAADPVITRPAITRPAAFHEA